MKCCCINHPEQIMYRRLNDIKKYAYGCKLCNQQPRKDFKVIKKAFERMNLTLISNESDYENIYTKLNYRCTIHSEIIQDVTWNDLKKGAGCYYCGIEKIRNGKLGENNPNWKGGTTEVNSWLRSCIDVWIKHKKLKITKCYITGIESERLELHHTFSFHKIRDITLNFLNLDLKDNVSDYSESERNEIRNTFIRLHNKSCTVMMLPEVHGKFHSIYGKDVTYRQLRDFKKRYINGEFDIEFK